VNDDMAWTRTEDGGLRLEPRVALGAVPIRMLRAGICGTDLQIQRGVRPDAAAVLGHEGLAEHQTPDGVRRVIFNPVSPDDQDRILGHSYDGVFRRFVPAAPDGAVLRDAVPAVPTLPADLAVLVEPLGAVLYGWDLVDAEDTVAVWGGGTTAVLAAMVGELRRRPVTLVHRRAERVDYLRRREILPHTTITMDAPAGGLSGAFICLPKDAAAAALAHALQAMAENATIDLFGGFGAGATHVLTGEVDLGAVRRANVCGRPVLGTATPVVLPDGHRVQLTGHRGTSAGHLLRAQWLLGLHPQRFGRVLSHVFSLESAGPVLRSMAGDPPGRRITGEHLKVVVDPTLPPGVDRAPDLVTTVADVPSGL
jgi:threonine dehydrogenase-like Zn-dependent dehydrogenase